MVGTRKLLGMLFILLGMLVGGCAQQGSQSPTPPVDAGKNEQQQGIVPGSQSNQTAIVNQEKMVVTVYNATKDATHLVAESRVVPKNDHPAQTAIESLVAGTKNTDLIAVMPKGTKLRNISVKDGIAYVDFNENLIKNNTGGSASEMLLVAAIVNTLTEFHNIQKVQILVEGKKIDSISGHMDIGEPLSRSEKIIKK
ncbi:GerMN domain-containing protein [Pelosinus sp. sgz500959]|uniref:GerMN domain-containing protein n=1 Tax=Pelosinus sp. sgz500959 TaxID=3242472 RepID=UPI0036710AF8